jgi:hypothetical protein
MAEAEVDNDASTGSLCRPPILAPKWQGQSLGLMVLVDPALIIKGEKESCLLRMELCELSHDVSSAGLSCLVAREPTPLILAAG